ncbi:hypothetical protein DLAC_11470 [Tieghemostelium lacteum]|uniref:Uncharacterized protein n=1 Tax=Tieghemostelium lacteum TaxID=361077 RepID=A0A152A898_TIELA|nr:hypothetical protein DLAC_11470 [Tieghemostelium lacteum]|eukprot:KYR02428.1 hypothetical protein DLAC_11470 [Tieghemostelium lacteum]
MADKRRRNRKLKQNKKKKFIHSSQHIIIDPNVHNNNHNINAHPETFNNNSSPNSINLIIQQCYNILQNSFLFSISKFDLLFNYFKSIIKNESAIIPIAIDNHPSQQIGEKIVSPNIIIQESNRSEEQLKIMILERKIIDLEREINRIKNEQSQVHKQNMNQYNELLKQIIKAAESIQKMGPLQQTLPMVSVPPPPPPPPPPLPLNNIKNLQSSVAKSTTISNLVPKKTSAVPQFSISVADLSSIKLRKTVPLSVGLDFGFLVFFG